MIGLPWYQFLPIILALAYLGHLAIGISQRAKAIHNHLTRLSITFSRIEIALDSLHVSMVHLAEGSENVADKIMVQAEIRDWSSRNALLELSARYPQDVMRGLELPDRLDDPEFWSKDILLHFGYSEDMEMFKKK